MKAKFATNCDNCKQEIKKNTEIENKNGKWIHAACPDLPGKVEKSEIKKPSEQKPKEEKPELKKANEIHPKTPHEEAEILVRWARERAYKITHAEVISLAALNSEQLRNLNIETNMLTKILVFAELKIHINSNLKFEY